MSKNLSSAPSKVPRVILLMNTHRSISNIQSDFFENNLFLYFNPLGISKSSAFFFFLISN